MHEQEGISLELDISYEDDCICALDEAEIAEAARFVLVQEQLTCACQLSISVVSNETIARLNKQWRGIDRPTDVLSLECESPDEATVLAAAPVSLGDIVLAPRYIAAQAADWGTDEANETRLLLVHGILHLLGYDHETDEEARIMEAREDELVSLLTHDTLVGTVQLTRHGLGDEQ